MWGIENRILKLEKTMNTQVSEVTLEIEGMSCGHCVGRVEEALNGSEGVVEATVDLASETAQVRFTASATTAADIAAIVTEAGYEAKAKGL